MALYKIVAAEFMRNSYRLKVGLDESKHLLTDN